MATLSPIRRAVLDLVGGFCYEGLVCTKIAYVHPDDRRLCDLKPNEFQSVRFRCEGPVPEPFIRACFIDVPTERQQELWGAPFPNMDAELRYLVDRGLLARSGQRHVPTLGGFINPHDGTEITSMIIEDSSVAAPELRLRWQVRGRTGCVIDATVCPDGLAIGYFAYKRTQTGHDLIEGSLGTQRESQAAEGDDGQRPGELTITEASLEYDVPKSTWSKAAGKPSGEPGYLPTRKVGRNRFVTKAHAKKFAEDYEARREQRAVGSKSPGNSVSASKKTRKSAR